MMEWSQPSPAPCDSFTWFTGSQLGSVIRNGVVPEWFHGIISRKTAEEILMSKPPGYFLIRVSESRIGYTLSYRAADRCRHFMIDALADGQYIILGENRLHGSLQDLVDFHRRVPIMPFTEVLTVACRQTSNDWTDYAELLFPQRHLNPYTSLLTNNSLYPSKTHPVSVEDVPPALPFRPNAHRNSTVLSPNSQPNRLYPFLEGELSKTTTPIAAMPVPLPRTRYMADNPAASHPPDVPARTSLPPLRQNQACIRTVSAPGSPPPFEPRAADGLQGAGVPPARYQEARPSVVANLKNLKKKFQKKKTPEYAEINMEAGDVNSNTEHEYQELTEQQTIDGPPFYYMVGPTNGRLPQEYLPPPPFAPGY